MIEKVTQYEKSIELVIKTQKTGIHGFYDVAKIEIYTSLANYWKERFQCKISL